MKVSLYKITRRDLRVLLHDAIEFSVILVFVLLAFIVAHCARVGGW